MRDLAHTSLSSEERALVERFGRLLRERLGDELCAVWLFGSRARGEPPGHEDSDVDLLVLVKDDSSDGKGRVHEAFNEVTRQLALQRTAFTFAIRVHTPEWLEGRRAIKSFFISEVDRDKVVIEGGMRPRSAEFMDAGRRRLSLARDAPGRDPASAISLAYYAMFYAARAALSERDTYAKTHTRTWNLFQQEFVDTREFDEGLLSEARKTQREREDADYEAWAAPLEEAKRVIALADRFLSAIAQLITKIEED